MKTTLRAHLTISSRALSTHCSFSAPFSPHINNVQIWPLLLLLVQGTRKKRSTLFSCRPIRLSPPPPTSISAPSERLSFSSFSLCCRHSPPTLQGKSHLCIPFMGIARPQSLFPHSCVCKQYIFPGSVHIFPCSRTSRLILEIYKYLTDIWL